MRICHNIALLSLSLVLLPLVAEAQDNAFLAREKSLWFNSGNAAGIGVSDFLSFNTADLGYSYETGPFHRMQEGKDEGLFRFNTQGSVKVGKIQLWGQFSYDNFSDSGTRYNTLVFDPFDERFIYNVADTTLSDWKRQSYDMEFKASVPLGERLHAGVHLMYSDRIAAKQNDPRSESMQYYTEIRPALVYRAGNSSIGLNAVYGHLQERSMPTLSNTSTLQNVFVLRGLGNYTEDMVGSGGLNTMYYSGNAYGGNLQYALDSSLEVLLEAGYLLQITDLRQDAVHPRDMGRSAVSDYTFNAQVLFGDVRLHKFNFGVLYRNTDGTEYATKQVTGVGWEVVSSAVMSRYSTLEADLDYNFFIAEGDSYTWNIYGGVSLVDKNDRYLAPHSSFTYTMLSVEAGARRQFLFRKSSLTAELGLLAGKNLGAEYVYDGTRKDSRPVEEWYPHDLKILSADHIRAGAGLEWLHRVGNEMSLGLKSDFSWLTAGDAGYRLCGSLGITMIF